MRRAEHRERERERESAVSAAGRPVAHASRRQERWLTMSAMSPSSGLGCSNRSLTVDRTVGMLRDGFQAPLGGMFSVSRHILPDESMFGW